MNSILHFICSIVAIAVGCWQRQKMIPQEGGQRPRLPLLKREHAARHPGDLRILLGDLGEHTDGAYKIHGDFDLSLYAIAVPVWLQCLWITPPNAPKQGVHGHSVETPNVRGGTALDKQAGAIVKHFVHNSVAMRPHKPAYD